MQPFRIVLFPLLFLTLCFCACTAQKTSSTDFDAEWKNVDELFFKKNLPQSALAEVKKIFEAAGKEKKEDHRIKALTYMIGLQQQTREENELLGFQEMENEIGKSEGPVASILNSLLAGWYWNYYQDNRWELYDRSETVQFKKDDISTWSAGDFHKKVSALYLASLENEEKLKQTKLEPFDLLLNKGNVRHLRPTLFDLLANRALDYFANDESDLTRPAYAFEIEQEDAFAPVTDFIKARFETRDSLSLKHKSLLLFQRILAFHLNDNTPDALIDADIRRIWFVFQNSTHPEKDSLYRKALIQLAARHGKLPAAAQARYLLANEYDNDADLYHPHGDSTYRFSRLKALEICNEVISQPDSSEGKINCLNLKNQIIQESLFFTLEKVNLPGQPFRVLIKFKNLNSVTLKIIQVDEEFKKNLRVSQSEKYWKQLFNAEAVTNWKQSLPQTNDYQEHAVEIKVDGLPAGDYYLLAYQENLEYDGLAAARSFHVTNISYINNDNDYFFLHRETGQPLVSAEVQVWKQVYNNRTRQTDTEKAGLFKTDNKGFCKIDYEKDPNQYSRSFKLEVTWEKDHFFPEDWIYDYSYRPATGTVKETAVSHRRIFLFTDRSIYRPGQTLYFKGIGIIPDPEKKNTVLTNHTSVFYLKDVNYQVVDSLTLTSNEFGSVSGVFQLPVSGLNGNFTIQEKEGKGQVQVSVEEYKRPKFYVEFEKINTSYKTLDSIRVTGKALAYAGNNIEGALVKYRVVRQPRFMYPWMFRRWWQPPSPEMEITHGEIQTAADGSFSIHFLAIPDKSIDKKFEPVFDYTVYADITDINGETRSGEFSISVSDQPLFIKSQIPVSLPADSLKTLYIRTENLGGEYLPSIIQVKISSLKAENRLMRKRYWERPDQFVFSKSEFIRHFPNDVYDNEDDPEIREIDRLVWQKTDSARVDYSFPVTAKLVPGLYLVEISTRDKNGKEVKDLRYVELTDEKNNRLTSPQYLWTQASTTIEPGEKTSVKIGSSALNVYLIQQLDKTSLNVQPKNPVYNFNQLNDEKKNFEFSADDADRGGYGTTWFFVKHNRFYQFSDIIRVPWSNKELTIEYATFRDKTLPGSGETWKVRISGTKKEKQAAEMLGSLYDASLDQFKMHSWTKPFIWPYYNNQLNWRGDNQFTEAASQVKWNNGLKAYPLRKTHDRFHDIFDNIQFGFNPRFAMKKSVALNEVVVTAEAAPMQDVLAGRVAGVAVKSNDDQETEVEEKPNTEQQSDIQVRKNFNETAFFFPQLKTDSSGAIEFSFTMPEALTRWKFQALAHTKDLAFGYSSREMITQKQLMVQPNPPRFLREGDKMEFSAKIVNLTDKELTGQAEFLLFDATTNESVSGWFQNMFPNQYFTVAAGQSESVRFPIDVPYQFNRALTWRIVAKAENFSDGEEASLPVLSNRMLVTESLPLHLKGSGTKDFRFEKLLNNNSETLKHHAITIEYSSNPAWYAVQALPYLMEYPYECSEQTWNRYYANVLASFIANSSPRINAIFEKWKNTDTAALLSNLQKNQELKSVLLEETPWVLQAKSEEQQKKNIGLLFDLVRMSREQKTALEKLKQLQTSNGGFAWFKGGRDNPYITQYIITGIGHLKKLGVDVSALEEILDEAIPYLDREIIQRYEDLKKYKTDLSKYTPGHYEIQYLYMRSFFSDFDIPAKSKTAYDYFHSRAQKTWVSQSKYMQGMIALALFRTDDKTTPAAILKSLKETSILHEELGRYWKENSGGWFWYQAPIETQALLIEVFQEAGNDLITADELRTWLLKNKQTNDWKTTKATAEACYALLLQGTNWLAADPEVTIQLGTTRINNKELKQEAGTGYIKQFISGKKVSNDLGRISVSVKSESNASSWGSVYWQYFEDLDKITTASTPLKLDKKLFVERAGDRGPVLTPVNEGDFLKLGDKIKVRIELRTDRDMEYVHMKDLRASCMEPVNVLSGYRWQGGLGYYETTKDASTNFFFDYVRKGTYVFEYTLYVTHTGQFSNGITSIQCMYAPEFSSHSEGIRVNVE